MEATINLNKINKNVTQCQCNIAQCHNTSIVNDKPTLSRSEANREVEQLQCNRHVVGMGNVNQNGRIEYTVPTNKYEMHRENYSGIFDDKRPTNESSVNKIHRDDMQYQCNNDREINERQLTTEARPNQYNAMQHLPICNVTMETLNNSSTAQKTKVETSTEIKCRIKPEDRTFHDLGLTLGDAIENKDDIEQFQELVTQSFQKFLLWRILNWEAAAWLSAI